MKCHLCDGEYKNFGTDLYCPKCVLLYTEVKAKPIDVYDSKYCEKYVDYSKSEINEGLQQLRWDTVLRHVRSGRLLDIGCGAGAFMKAAPKGFSVIGQDVNRYCIIYCKQIGVEADETSPIETFDVVTMFDSLEHFPVFDIVKYVRHVLRTGGRLVLGIPNFRAELLTNIEEWRHYRPDEHVFGFSETAIYQFCDKFGFECDEANDDESEARPPAGNISIYVLRKA